MASSDMELQLGYSGFCWPQTRKQTQIKLDDSRTSMPALARPCTSGVETSKHMQVTCWHCGCWDHYEWVDNQYVSPYRTGGKWLPWFLRKSRPFIFKYRPLGPTYFNIWGIFTIVGIILIKWYNISLMHFASLTLEGAHPLIMPITDFHQKIEKIKIFHFFFQNYTISLLWK